jgi:hypothetical protein
MFDSPAPTPRRSFLTRLAILAAASPFAVRPRRDAAGQQPVQADDAWLRRLTGKHRTMFDVEKHRNGHALGQAASMLEVWRRDYHLEAPNVNLVFGARGTGIPMLLSDALWARYRLGEQYDVVKPGTKEPFQVNPFSAANAQAAGLVTTEQTVETLQQRGVLFLACRNTIAAASKRLAAAGLGAAEEVQRTLEGGLLPSVVLVPAMLIAFTNMHEKGVTYVYAG